MVRIIFGDDEAQFSTEEMEAQKGMRRRTPLPKMQLRG